MMNFSRKLNLQFGNFEMVSPNCPKYIEHIYADYIELNALFSKEEVTIADIIDKLQDTKDQSIIDIEETDQPQEISTEIASKRSEINDKIHERILSLFDICRSRQLLYDKSEYPFNVEGNIIKIKDEITHKQKLYIFLLFCSNLKYFGNLTHELTVDFERLSYYSLKSFLPNKAAVKPFGKTSSYTGNAKTKIETLASEISIEVNPKKISCIPPTSAQERGLDLIAWIPFEDKIPNMVIILCQCACGNDWNIKQYDTQRFKEYFVFDKTPIHGMFVPYSMSKTTENKFYQHDEILNDHLLFDRKRIIEQIEDWEFLSELVSINIVNRALEHRISV